MPRAKLGPLNKSEREVFAVEGFRVDVQVAIQRLMNETGVNQKELAKRLDVTEARVSQILSDRCNLTIRQLARIFFVLGCECRLESRPTEAAG